jgi:hypothetical protein
MKKEFKIVIEYDELTALGQNCTRIAWVGLVGGTILFMALGRTWLDLLVYLIGMGGIAVLGLFGLGQLKNPPKNDQTP